MMEADMPRRQIGQKRIAFAVGHASKRLPLDEMAALVDWAEVDRPLTQRATFIALCYFCAARFRRPSQMVTLRGFSMIRFSTTCRGSAFAALGLILSLAPASVRADSPARALPPPALDVGPMGPGLQKTVFAGGCFWGVQAVFEHVKGVTQAVSGYAGGTVANPSYEQVSSGTTGHAESVQVTFDPSRVTYGKLLQIFFSVALDPTEVNRQGPDWGTQYRSELFVSSPEQERVARAYVEQLQAAHEFDHPIATRIDPAGAFYPAEAYHQDYLVRHPNDGYIAVNDIPKLRSLQQLFPENWLDTPVMAGKLASGS
jgi:peptide-methionine (S)-S-oxide reductase